MRVILILLLFLSSPVFAGSTAVITGTTSAVTTTGTVFGISDNHCRVVQAQPALQGSETANFQQTTDDGTTWSASGTGFQLDTTYQKYVLNVPGLYRPIKDATNASVGIFISKEYRCN